MSSFGFNRPTATDFRHPSHGLGFGTAPDPFASISQNRGSGPDDDDAYVLSSSLRIRIGLTSAVLSLMTHMMV